MTSLCLTVADTALSLNINSSEDLLKQCLAAALPIARSCRNGNCGRCDCQLESGTVVLRNGKVITAPATIALCISHARSDLRIAKMPLNSIAQHWRCEGLNLRQLQLPAGRQSPPQNGDMVALLLRNSVLINSVEAVAGRIITLQDPCPDIEQHKNKQLSIGLLNIDREHHGDFALWCHGNSNDHTQLLWRGINQATGLAAQAAYRHANNSDDYQLRTLNSQ
ncbi:2Fe-2S iron-sulfur cluster-binding protein [Zhongshania sp.]|uniref:2Fe-2S iron-sulfur cluster-binding protein n=1 Tax=Zhongshania sp. TaxID=1971902 RepID=UPI00356814A1